MKRVTRIDQKSVSIAETIYKKLSSFSDKMSKVCRVNNMPNLKIARIHNELNRSEIGRQTLKYMNNNNIDVILSYNWDIEKGLTGRAYNDYVAVFVKYTQSYSEIAKTVIHEVTHVMGEQGSRRTEMFCRIRELKHIYQNQKISTNILKKEFQLVNRYYSDLPMSNGEKYTSIINIR